jgi:hypothetical protein
MNKTILFLFVILFWGCEESDTNVNFENGNYSGTFIITESDGQPQSGNVIFNFSNNSYSVVPEKLYLPPVGGGTFSINGNTIVLVDTAIHTAEFDWTLILNGSFELSYNGNILILKQNDTTHNRKRIISLTKQN